MNRPSQQFSRRSDFALLNIDLTEEPDSFTDEHLHEHFRNIEIDPEIGDFDHFDQPHVHVPSWGNNHRRGRRGRRIHSDAAVDPSPSMADILGHGDSVALSSSSSSSSFLGSVREGGLSFLLGAGRDSVSLAGRRGVPALSSGVSYCRDDVGGGGRVDDDESFDFAFPFLNRDSVSLAGRRGVPTSSISKGENDDDDDAPGDSHILLCSVNGAAFFIRGESQENSSEEEECDHGGRDATDSHSLEDLLLSERDCLSVTRTHFVGGHRARRSGTRRTSSLSHSRRMSDMTLEEDLYDGLGNGDDLLVSWPHQD